MPVTSLFMQDRIPSLLCAFSWWPMNSRQSISAMVIAFLLPFSFSNLINDVQYPFKMIIITLRMIPITEDIFFQTMGFGRKGHCTKSYRAYRIRQKSLKM